MAPMGALGRDRAGALVASVMLLLSQLTLRTAEGADSEQLVTNLPGAPVGLNFTQYAGYVTVNETNGRALFYWFITSSSGNATSKPVSLWLNGGPGYSSVGDGLLAELGPFRPAGQLNDIHLALHDFSWIQHANIIFLESPVGVGFSYSNTSSDYDHFTDQRTAEDALQFLLNWYEKFPEYRTNEFYINGESYGGHYVPTLAREIVRHNDAQLLRSSSNSSLIIINFKGWAVGNPFSDAYFNNLGEAEGWYTRDLIAYDTYQTILENCNFSNLLGDKHDQNATCAAAVSEVHKTDLGFLDPFDIYAEKCNNNLTSDANSTESKCPSSPDLRRAFLNTREVQEALHVQSGGVTWTAYNLTVNHNYDTHDIIASMWPIYTELMGRGLRIWIYHGDVDAVAPPIATRSALRALDLEIQTPWYPWEYDRGVGGFTEIYKNLTFATVRGSGHLVPHDKPGPALVLFHHFVDGTALPVIA